VFLRKIAFFVVLGTRPEAIKLLPLVHAATRRDDVEVVLCNTGQHREMSAKVLAVFGLKPDIDLDVMQAGQSLTDVTVRILAGLQPHLERLKPDWLVVQGDTTTTMTAALAAFYQKVPVAHVEAGLRTGDIYAPWPEEMNRRLVSEIAALHFPPTEAAAANLVREGISPERILVTGNTGIDALKWLTGRLTADDSLRTQARAELLRAGVPVAAADNARPYVLITGHRRESFGAGFEAICAAIGELADRYPGHDFIYPVHPNPRVRETVYARLGSALRSNVHLIDPLDYLPFVALMSNASLILTDSGGVQEEAPSLGRRVVVLRDVTERMEGLETGLIRLAGTDRQKIVSDVGDALDGVWAQPERGCDVYGDGHASDRVLDAMCACSHVLLVA
jgi:UDP-N-acetylglucosamine 2-epimerase (non-hydrolysing)